MKSKSFYINRSNELHAKRDAAIAAVVSVEREIDENIRLINMAPNRVEEVVVPDAPAVEALVKEEVVPVQPKPQQVTVARKRV